MARKSLLALCAATALAACTIMPANAAPATPKADGADRFIVTYADGPDAHPQRATAQKAQAAKKGKNVKESRIMGTGAEVIVLDSKLDAAATASFMADLKAQPGVAAVEVDRIMRPTAVPTDPSYASSQWDMKANPGMNVEPARDIATGAGVTVAVIDTGITPHSEFSGRVLPGYDMISDASIARDAGGRDSNPNDEGDWVEANDPDCGDGRFYSSSWHGTHVAGTVLAGANNGIGIAGVAPQAKLVPVRVLGRCGGYTSDIVDGMLWAAGLPVPGLPANANPAKVLNMSLGGSGQCSSTQQRAINQITAAGSTIVVAAGNDGQDVAGYDPGNCSGVITVASSTPSRSLAWYSNYGTRIDITAPGGDTSVSGGGIYSTVNTGVRTQSSAGYGWMQGTSMAAPHIAGLAALMYQADPTITPSKVLSVIKSTAKPMTCSKGCGAGLADAAAAVKAVAGNGGGGGGGGETPVSTLVNGGFEQGSTGWAGDTWTIGTDPTHPARSGAGYLWLLGYGKTTAEQVNQTVTVPAGGKLSFYLKVNSAETSTYTAYDTLKVEVRDTAGYLLKTAATYSNKDKGSSYVLRTVDLSAFAGQKVQLRFSANEDSMYATTFLVDDVALSGSAA